MKLYSNNIIYKEVEIINDSTKQIEFYIVDNNDNQIFEIFEEDFKILENSNEIRNILIDCKKDKDENSELSSLLMMDISGSMSGEGIEIAKEVSNLWVDLINKNIKSYECALGTFDHKSSIIQGFTQSPYLLKYAINTLMPDGGTSFNEAFLGEGGGLNFLKSAKYARKLILLTDGLSDVNSRLVVEIAKKYNIEIYCLVLNFPVPQSLKVISKESGGLSFGNINNLEHAKEICKKIFNISKRNYKFCKVIWNSKEFCEEIALNYLNKTYNLKYSNQLQKYRPYIDIENNLVILGKNSSIGKDTLISFNTKNGNITVDSIVYSNGVKNLNKLNFPKVYNKNENIDLEVSFDPNIMTNYSISIYSSCDKDIIEFIKPISDPPAPILCRYGFGTTSIITDITKSQFPNYNGFHSGFGFQFYLTNWMALRLGYGFINISKDVALNDVINNINFKRAAGASLRLNFSKNNRTIFYFSPGISYQDNFIENQYNDGWNNRDGEYTIIIGLPIGVEWFFDHNLSISLQYELIYQKFFSKYELIKEQNKKFESYLGYSLRLRNFPTLLVSYYIN